MRVGSRCLAFVLPALFAAPAGAAPAAPAPPAPAPAAGVEGTRPNFVFILTDDHRWDALGVVQREQGDRARFPWLQTPNLDRLAAEGVRFRNAFVVNSLCAPSRASFLTGCYGHVNGIVNNHTPFFADRATHASLLRAAGYATGYVGKWHMDGQRERPGFDFAASFVGQGRYFDCPFLVNGKPTPTRGWVDDVSTDYAVQFLRENAAKPFLLVVGYKTAHGPFEPPDRRKEDFAGQAFQPVPSLGLTALYRAGAGGEALRAKGRANLGYFRCLAGMDDNVGRLLKALDELGAAEKTVLVFAGDNGYYLGEHGLGDKRSAYEESLRIPLLLRYPKLGLKGRTVDALVLNVDLAPTFLDYAGVAAPKEMQGRSWRPLLEGKAADWRRAFFYCYFFETGFATPTVTAVRTAAGKLVRYPGHKDWTEVYDLAADPYETRNLADDGSRADLREELEAEYERQAAAIDFRIPEFADESDATASPRRKR
jgi:arylsulfatase A-like enzyme